MSHTTLRMCTTQTSHMSRTTLHMCNTKRNVTFTLHLAATLEHDLGPRPPTQLSITAQQRGREPGNILQVSHVGREEVEERVCGSSRTAKKREATFTLLPVQVHTHTNKVSRSTPLYP